MINQQTLQGNWNEIKGKLRSKWGSLTDDDVKVFNGNVEQLVGTIQRKTGATSESIEQFFEQFEFRRRHVSRHRHRLELECGYGPDKLNLWRFDVGHWHG